VPVVSRHEDEIDWHEVDPDIGSIDRRKLSHAVDLIQSRQTAAQLCVIRHGRLVIERSFGCDPQALFWIFSASKPYVAMLVHLLADRGAFSLDDAISAHWPQFAANGKHAITIRQVLQHRSALSASGTALGDLSSLTHWRRSVRRMERARPRWTPGEVPAYLPLGYGFILGELVQRVTGRPVAEALEKELLRPLGARDTFLGLPRAQWRRHVPIRASRSRDLLVQLIANRSSTRRAVIPAGGISCTASDLARFYFMLLRSGRYAGRHIMSAAAVKEARVPSNESELDRTARLYIRWAQGFQLGGPRVDPGSVSSFGRLSSPSAFGHNGSNCCIGWADPDRDLVFAYLTNRLSTRKEGATHLASVADAVISSCL